MRVWGLVILCDVACFCVFVVDYLQKELEYEVLQWALFVRFCCSFSRTLQKYHNVKIANA